MWARLSENVSFWKSYFGIAEEKFSLILVRQLDILLKEVFEIACCCWELGKQRGNALIRGTWAIRWVCNTCLSRNCCSPPFCVQSKTVDAICVHERWPQQLQGPAAGLHPPPTSSDQNIPGHEAGSSCSWTSCDNCCCFPFLVFTGLLICLSLDGFFWFCIAKSKKNSSSRESRAI